jgi:hypothetical protein
MIEQFLLLLQETCDEVAQFYCDCMSNSALELWKESSFYWI